MKMKNEIPAFTLQSYILNIWNTLLNQNDNNNSYFNLFERLPYDALYCFSKKELDDKNEIHLNMKFYNHNIQI